MEDTLRGGLPSCVNVAFAGLNPCSNGRYSQRILFILKHNFQISLNPCFNGSYSQRERYVLE